jgi:hemolysin activation/secretion protein
VRTRSEEVSEHFLQKNREKMRLRFLMPLVAIGFTAMSAHVQAATVPDFVNPGAGPLLQELEKQAPKAPLLPTPVAPKEKVKPKPAKPSEVKVTIKGFRIDGNKTLSEELIKETLKPWLGKTVAFQELQKAADSVAALYQSQGFLAQVSVPPQRITDGIVILKVLEAKLGAVNVDMPNGPSRFGEDKARRYVTDANRLSEIVQTRNIERSIYILNETPGIAVASQLQPGKNEGEVDINLSLADTAPVRGRLEWNNHGSRATGTGQRVVNLVFDGLTGNGDQLSASNIKSDGSDYSLASYSLPINSDGLRAGITGSYLDYENVNKFAPAVNRNAGFGRAKTIGVNLTYPTLRTPAANSNVTASFDRKMYLNKKAVDGEISSDYRVENMVFGYNANQFDQWLGGGVTQGSISLTKGHISFGSETLAVGVYGVKTPTTFTKINANLSRSHQIVQDKTILNVSASGQMASVDLDSSEKFYLGGPNGVRGYPGSQAGGSQGAMINIELQQALEDKMIASVFFDAGFVQQARDKGNFEDLGANNSYSLRSLGVGLKRPGTHIIWSTSIAWKLGHNPLEDYRGNAVNNDGLSKSAYIWANVQFVF